MLKLAFLTTDNREHDNNYSAPVPYFGTAPTALLEGFANLPDLEVHILSCTQQPMSSPAKLANNILFHSLHVPKIGWLRTGYAGCILAVRKKLSEIQPDIVHGQGTERDCAISSVFSGFPNVITIHGNMAALARLFHARWGSFNWWAARLEDFTLPRTAGVLCNSVHTKSLVAPRAKLTWIVPNSLRRGFFIKPLDISRNMSALLILVIASVTPNKRQLEILSFLRGVRNKGFRFQVVFIGCVSKDAYARRFLAYQSGAEKEGWSSFSGFLDELDLIKIMDKAHALLHFPQEEAFGLVVAESLARGLKLFASKVGGICDIASGVPEADLFDPEDWAGLSRALSAWLEKPNLSSARTQYLMKFRYHPNIIAARHIESYREVLSDSRLS
jgi:glycosyltransferase involved in cell wall biosynthesis